MGFLNNANVIISILVGLFGIVGYLVGIVTYLRHKAASAQQQTTQCQPVQSNVPQTASKQLSKLDWMEVLWYSLVALVNSNRMHGMRINLATAYLVFMGIIVVGYGSVLLHDPAFGYIFMAITGTIYVTFIILAYVYFVGRRVEQKVKELNQPQATKQTASQSIK